MKMMTYDMDIVHWNFITIDDDKTPAPKNITAQQQQQQGQGQQGGEVLKPEGIIFPLKAKTFHNYFTCFWNYIN